MNFLSYCIVALSLAGVAYLQEKHPQAEVTENISFKFNERIPTFSAETIRLISFGYPRIVSNILWLRFLQQTPPKPIPEEELSWIYFDIDSITNIDPDFYAAYERGGVFLSVITSDKIGAERILVKGTNRFPDDWQLRSYLGYHYYYELDQRQKAGEQYLIAARDPRAPPVMSMLAARHLANTITPEASIEFLENLRKNATDPIIRKNYAERIEMWKKKILMEGKKK